MTNKEHYRNFCAANNIVPVFINPLWLDAVAENWDVCLISESEKIIAALPYCWKGNLFTKRIYLPDVSFYQSVVFFTAADKNKKQKLTEQLVLQLPSTVKSYFKFLPEYFSVELNKLNYQKEEYSTYILQHENELLLSTNHKRNVQKGITLNFQVKESKHLEASFVLLTSTFVRQQIKPKVTFTEFKKINSLVKKHNFGKTLDCYDEHKNLLASVFVIEDTDTVYYLFGGFNSEYKNSGAMTFLLYCIIQDAIQRKLNFNFCGSTRKSIATYFEGYGANKTAIAIWKKSIF